MVLIDSGTTIILFGNPKMIINRQKAEIPMNLLIKVLSKIVYKVGEITGSGKTISSRYYNTE